MARTVRNARLENRTQRLKLAKEKFHWHALSDGIALGYRRTKAGFGTWTVRILEDRTAGRYATQAIGKADDYEDADGREIFTYFQAADRARSLIGQVRDKASGGHSKPLTVEAAIGDYLEWFKAHRKSHAATLSVLNAHVRKPFGRKLVADVTTREIQRWHEALATTPARARSRKTDPTIRHQAQDLSDPDVARRRKASANRILTVFRAVLNHAWRQGHVTSDTAWRRVRPFHSAGEPRVRYLEAREAVALVEACPPDFRKLVRAALLTGCRYGELVQLRVDDFRADSQNIFIRDSKSGRPRHVPLNAEGTAFFLSITSGRSPAHTMLTRVDGTPWGVNHQVRPMAEACEAAKIEPAVSFHILRHTYGSWLAMRGVALQVIAEVLGHADTRITQHHYGHLAPSYVAHVIRENLPPLETVRADKTAPAKESPAIS